MSTEPQWAVEFGTDDILRLYRERRCSKSYPLLRALSGHDARTFERAFRACMALGLLSEIVLDKQLPWTTTYALTANGRLLLEANDGRA